MLNRQNAKVDFYFAKSEKWQQELRQLRELLLASGLTEELKWGVPCYTYQGKNVALLHEFKEYCALLFPKGALLRDEQRRLVAQTENTQAARQLRFTSTRQLAEQADAVRAYVQNALEVEQAGLKVPLKKTAEFAFPAEFRQKLTEMPVLKTAFEALTPGRQRAYLLYFSAPKQVKTRAARIEKCVPQIFEGRGLND